MQTRTGSAVEALANIVVGFTINWTANMLVLPLFGFAVTGAQAFGIGLIFTVISLVRSYVLRRWFNGLRWGNRTASGGYTSAGDWRMRAHYESEATRHYREGAATGWMRGEKP